MVIADIGGHPVQFLLDMGAAMLVLKSPMGPLSDEMVSIQGATRNIKKCPMTSARIVDLGNQRVSHSFIVEPNCPYSLLGRDLLRKLKAHISFSPERTELSFSPIYQMTVVVPLSEEYLVMPESTDKETVSNSLMSLQAEFPQVWAEDNPPGLAGHHTPVVVDLLATAEPVRVKQYPMSQKAHMGIAVHIHRLLTAGILKPCKSSWNTPLLPVQKPGTEDYRPVQDFREVNKRVQTIHPTVPNPYTLLSLLSPDHVVYTVLDLKDAFFSIPLAPISQPIFAFEWTDPVTGDTQQLTWTRLPQGFKNSPTLFGEALQQDLQSFRIEHPDLSLLQYVDDILLAAPDNFSCL